jgi:hypothetical protein
LVSQRPHLRFQILYAPLIGATRGCTARHWHRGCGCARRSGQRFERTNHHLHFGELFLELLDTLAELRLTGGTRWYSILLARLTRCSRRRSGRPGRWTRLRLWLLLCLGNDEAI